uniref:Uncharacterized protein n=1 Tax=Marseillevirus sp. TaxID=2809551 RepID=A0AA96EPN2_9VIRU|nr:hypothetical protein MarDSR_415 [Marseillevirus sp.]
MQFLTVFVCGSRKSAAFHRLGENFHIFVPHKKIFYVTKNIF